MGIRCNGDGHKSTARSLIHLALQPAETLINNEIAGVPGSGDQLLFYICRDRADTKLLKQVDDIQLRIHVSWKAISFNPDDANEADIELDWDERKIGDLGLFMIKELIDDIKYDQIDGGGNLLILTKKLN